MPKYKSIIFFFVIYKMEPTNQNNNINATKETRQLFNELRSNLSREEINRFRKKLNKKESIYNL